MRKYKAALLGYYGFGNLGDELLLRACVELLTSCGVKDSEIVILSNSPGINSVNRWSFREVCGTLSSSECLILGGGGLFQDSTSVKSCVWYWGVVRLARLLGCKVWALGQSIGPLNSRTARILTVDALKHCRHIHVRDQLSASLIESKVGSVSVGQDLVFSLSVPRISRRDNGCTLINLRPHELTQNFIGILKAHVNSQTVGAALSDEDIPCLQALGLSNIVRVRSFEQAAELWADASQAVGMRLHFGVLSRIFRVPCALMPYSPKVSEFAASSAIPAVTDTWLNPEMPLSPPNDCCDTIRSWISTELLS